jgi:hypothetical protein
MFTFIPALKFEHAFLLSDIYLITDYEPISGTGKTTVVIKILEILLKRLMERTEDEDDSDTRILMTASTHNGRLVFHNVGLDHL